MGLLVFKAVISEIALNFHQIYVLNRRSQSDLNYPREKVAPRGYRLGGLSPACHFTSSASSTR